MRLTESHIAYKDILFLNVLPLYEYQGFPLKLLGGCILYKNILLFHELTFDVHEDVLLKLPDGRISCNCTLHSDVLLVGAGKGNSYQWLGNYIHHMDILFLHVLLFDVA